MDSRSLDSSIKAFVTEDGDATTQGTLINSIYSALITPTAPANAAVPTLIEKMEFCLISDNEVYRRKGVSLIARFLTKIGSVFASSAPNASVHSLNAQTLHLLSVFLCRRLSDYQCLIPAVDALHAVVKYYHVEFDPKNCDLQNIITSLFADVYLQSYAQNIRQKVLEFLLEVFRLPEIVECLESKGTDTIENVIVAIEGEKDPRCLLRSLELSTVVSQRFARYMSPDLSERMFNTTGCYFPITFKPPKDDPFGITSKMLIDALENALLAHDNLLVFVVPHLMDQLRSGEDASDFETKCHALSYLKAAVEKYSYKIFCFIESDRYSTTLLTEVRDVLYDMVSMSNVSTSFRELKDQCANIYDSETHLNPKKDEDIFTDTYLQFCCVSLIESIAKSLASDFQSANETENENFKSFVGTLTLRVKDDIMENASSDVTHLKKIMNIAYAFLQTGNVYVIDFVESQLMSLLVLCVQRTIVVTNQSFDNDCKEFLLQHDLLPYDVTAMQVEDHDHGHDHGSGCCGGHDDGDNRKDGCCQDDHDKKAESYNHDHGSHNHDSHGGGCCQGDDAGDSCCRSKKSGSLDQINRISRVDSSLVDILKEFVIASNLSGVQSISTQSYYKVLVDVLMSILVCKEDVDTVFEGLVHSTKVSDERSLSYPGMNIAVKSVYKALFECVNAVYQRFNTASEDSFAGALAVVALFGDRAYFILRAEALLLKADNTTVTSKISVTTTSSDMSLMNSAMSVLASSITNGSVHSKKDCSMLMQVAHNSNASRELQFHAIDCLTKLIVNEENNGHESLFCHLVMLLDESISLIHEDGADDVFAVSIKLLEAITLVFDVNYCTKTTNEIRINALIKINSERNCFVHWLTSILKFSKFCDMNSSHTNHAKLVSKFTLLMRRFFRQVREVSQESFNSLIQEMSQSLMEFITSNNVFHSSSTHVLTIRAVFEIFLSVFAYVSRDNAVWFSSDINEFLSRSIMVVENFMLNSTVAGSNIDIANDELFEIATKSMASILFKLNSDDSRLYLTIEKIQQVLVEQCLMNVSVSNTTINNTVKAFLYLSKTLLIRNDVKVSSTFAKNGFRIVNKNSIEVSSDHMNGIAKVHDTIQEQITAFIVTLLSHFHSEHERVDSMAILINCPKSPMVNVLDVHRCPRTNLEKVAFSFAKHFHILSENTSYNVNHSNNNSSSSNNDSNNRNKDSILFVQENKGYFSPFFRQKLVIRNCEQIFPIVLFDNRSNNSHVFNVPSNIEHHESNESAFSLSNIWNNITSSLSHISNNGLLSHHDNNSNNSNNNNNNHSESDAKNIRMHHEVSLLIIACNLLSNFSDAIIQSSLISSQNVLKIVAKSIQYSVLLKREQSNSDNSCNRVEVFETLQMEALNCFVSLLNMCKQSKNSELERTIELFIDDLIPILIELSQSSRFTLVRFQALECIEVILSLSIAYSKLYRHKASIVKGLINVLNDNKRIVRMKAAKVRNICAVLKQQ